MRSRAAAAATVLMLMTAACESSAPEPSAEPTPVAVRWIAGRGAAARAATQVVAPPTAPPAGSALPGNVEQTPEEADAAAFGRWFMELFPYIHNTGDTALWEAVSSPECSYCASVLEVVRSDATAGIENAYGPVTVTHARASARWWADPGDYLVSLTLTVAPAEDRGPDGLVTDRRGPTRYDVSVAVALADGEWLVEGVSAAAVQELPLGGEPIADTLPVDVVEPGSDRTSAGVGTSVRYSLLRAYAEATGDLGPLSALESPECTTCSETHAFVTSLADAVRPHGAQVRFETGTCWTGDPLPWVECHVWLSRTIPGRAPSYSHDITRVTWDGTRWAVSRTFQQDEVLPPTAVSDPTSDHRARHLPVVE
ncbi:hypothetical protein N867_05640 [Actinotalea fermentans ATCC 43279 = JCM 9966 = DSM 3133]|nr:hypothetical protein N867_05640 [Actinotalea fermentans ATCC 43279 = JCM 9966 = DSM 3133]